MEIIDVNAKFKLDLENSKDRAIFNLMCYLQDLGEEKNFIELQKIMDECNVNDWDDGTALVTILMVTHWYGQHLNRQPFYEKVREFFIVVIGYDEKKTDNMLKGLKGTWNPTFGFERELFGISE